MARGGARSGLAHPHLLIGRLRPSLISDWLADARPAGPPAEVMVILAAARAAHPPVSSYPRVQSWTRPSVHPMSVWWRLAGPETALVSVCDSTADSLAGDHRVTGHGGGHGAGVLPHDIQAVISPRV